jgi:succinate dehydrogenase/fumarate reductase flavoprotein subunit
MLDVAEAIAVSALHRRETRGAHARTDYPMRDDAEYLKHSIVSLADRGPTLEYKPVTLTRWKPDERKY